MRAKPWAAGDQFGRLTAIGPESRLGVRNHRAVLCRCQCGTEKIVALDKLRDGHTSSCGCLRSESARGMISVARQKKNAPVLLRDEDLGRAGLHRRLKKDRGLASEYSCSYADDTCKGVMQWANISQRYLSVGDFMPLCQSHHARYDRVVRNMKDRRASYLKF